MLSHFLESVHPSWLEILEDAVAQIDDAYLRELIAQDNWLPGPQNLFAAFSMPRAQTKFLLLGESPYPRKESANGYAFWDAKVDALWSPTGLSKPVNRATSLRNFIKMLLFARGDVSTDLSQSAIADLCKSNYVQTGRALFRSMIAKGFLLLNASLVYRQNKVLQDAREWRPFMQSLLASLRQTNPNLTLILFGKIAEKYTNVTQFATLVAPHPYNISFIQDPRVIEFFKPLDLLATDDKCKHR